MVAICFSSIHVDYNFNAFDCQALTNNVLKVYNIRDMNINDIKCFLLDLDGTVYIDGKLIAGAKQAIERMRKQGRVVFLTNNSSVTKDRYVKKLNDMELGVTELDIYTSTDATKNWLKKNRPFSRLYVVGSDEVISDYAKDFCVTPPFDTVVLTFDKTLTYDKLVKACDLISRGALYLATHPDYVCPMETGYIPDVGSFIMLVEGATKRKPDVICGKPYAPMAEGISEFTGVSPRFTAMFGDRLMTDIKFACDNGMTGVLVLSGEATEEDYLSSGLKAIVKRSIAEWDR